MKNKRPNEKPIKRAQKPVLNIDALVYKVDRTIYFFDEIEPESVCTAIRFIDELEKDSSKKDIEFIISSPGGFIYEGFALYDRIRRCPCNVNMTGTGMVASMALIIFLAGDYRYVTETCVLLNHQASDELDGRTSDLKIGIKETVRIEALTNKIVADHTRLTEKDIIDAIQKGDNYISAERALLNGFAHEILKNQPVVKRRKKKKQSIIKRKKKGR